MAVGDIYQCKLKSTMDSQECLNVFYYADDGLVASDSASLLTSFNTHIVGLLQAITSGYAGYTELEAFNLLVPGDFATLALSAGGTVSGDVYPVFMASGFKYLRSTRLTRNGAKRFVGVPESASADGINRTSGYVTTTDALAVALAANLPTTFGSFRPVIFHKTSGPGDPLAGVGYPIDGVVWERFTSQVSRKF